MQLNSEGFDECEKNVGWRSVLEFQSKNLVVLYYFWYRFYTTRRQIDGNIRYVAIFFLFEKICGSFVLVHDCGAWSKAFKGEIL